MWKDSQDIINEKSKNKRYTIDRIRNFKALALEPTLTHYILAKGPWTNFRHFSRLRCLICKVGVL